MNDNPILEGKGEETSSESKTLIRRARRSLAPFTADTKTVENLPEEKEDDKAIEEDETIEMNSTPEEADSMPEAEEEPSLSSKALYENIDEREEKSEKEFSTAANAFDWIKSFLFSLTVVIFIFTLLFRGVTVNGGSMLPTLHNGEYLVISNLFYDPKPGDIVVVQSPHYKDGTEPLIKRIIATEGQTIRINFTTWEVWVDGVLLEEDYILKDDFSMMNCEHMFPDKDGIAETVVEENSIFVMGDNRNDSLDSRSEDVGQIDERYIMGRVLIRITPLERFGKVD